MNWTRRWTGGRRPSLRWTLLGVVAALALVAALSVGSAASPAGAAPSAQANFTGTWSYLFCIEQGPLQVLGCGEPNPLTLNQTQCKLTGNVSQGGTVAEVAAGTVDGNSADFTLTGNGPIVLHVSATLSANGTQMNGPEYMTGDPALNSSGSILATRTTGPPGNTATAGQCSNPTLQVAIGTSIGSAALRVGQSAKVTVKVTARRGPLSSVNLGKGLVATGGDVKITGRPASTAGFSLAQDKSRTFVYTVKGIKGGNERLRIQANGKAGTKAVHSTVSTSLTVSDAKIFPVQKIEKNGDTSVDVKATGWSRTGGAIRFQWSAPGGQGPISFQVAPAVDFSVKYAVRLWPARSNIRTAPRNVRGTCWGYLNARQGTVSVTKKLTETALGAVLFSPLPVFRSGDVYCHGEDTAVLPKVSGLLYFDAPNLELVQANGVSLPFSLHGMPPGQHLLCVNYPTLNQHVVVNVVPGPALTTTISPGGTCAGVSSLDPSATG